MLQKYIIVSLLLGFSLILPPVSAKENCNQLVIVGSNKYAAIAKRAGLHYRKSFGRSLPRTKKNKARLGIPPGWKNVWISPNSNSHVLARGFDEAGREQRIYHPKWKEAAAAYKYNRIIEFGRRIPLLRKAVERDLTTDGLSKRRLVAGVLRLMDMRPVRVGSKASAKTFGHYGVTTLRKKHIKKLGNKIVDFIFKGKGGVKHDFQVSDASLASLLKDLVAQPGYELFRYVGDNGKRYDVDEADVNAYLKKIIGEKFSVKDMRTWSATSRAMKLLMSFDTNVDIDTRVGNLESVFGGVGAHLINKPNESKRSYIHPEIIQAYEGDTLFSGIVNSRLENQSLLRLEERALLRYFN